MFVDTKEAAKVKQDSEVVATLKAAKALIADMSNWTQGTYCRQSDGSACQSHPQDATQFCAVGALWMVLGSKEGFYPMVYRSENTVAGRLLNYASKIGTSYTHPHPVKVNDNLGHAAVMQMYDVAIEKAEREGL